LKRSRQVFVIKGFARVPEDIVEEKLLAYKLALWSIDSQINALTIAELGADSTFLSGSLHRPSLSFHVIPDSPSLPLIPDSPSLPSLIIYIQIDRIHAFI
jgi:hypothetical protein